MRVAHEARREGVEVLLAKGVTMPNPAMVTIAPDVNPDRISGDGVVLYPGCRVDGAQTVICAGVRLGEQGPVMVSSCWLGPDVALNGGYAARSVFLRGAHLGLGHHVRAGSLLEEEVSGADGVGLKQTILFPFVSLGSLINFCDVLMAGGTSRAEHSEVGSSYIHFNYTPGGDKTTPSVFGDIARGVMLDRSPVFLGGRGGAVGPVSVGYGSVIAAGTVLRADVSDGQVVTVAPPKSRRTAYRQGGYRDVDRIVAKNLTYLASLRVLRAWYDVIRRPFFAAQDLGELLYEGALEMLILARTERVHQLVAMLGKVEPTDDQRAALRMGITQMCERVDADVDPAPADLVVALETAAGSGARYVDAVRSLDPALAADGSRWLATSIDALVASAYDAMPAARLSGPDAIPLA